MTGETMTLLINRKGTNERTARDLLTYQRTAVKWGMAPRQAKVFATYFVDATNANIRGGLWSAWCEYNNTHRQPKGLSNSDRDAMNGFMLRHAKRHYTLKQTSVGWQFCHRIRAGYYLAVLPSAPTNHDHKRIACFNRHVQPALKPLYKRAELSPDAPWQVLADKLIDANDEQGAALVRSLFAD